LLLSLLLPRGAALVALKSLPATPFLRTLMALHLTLPPLQHGLVTHTPRAAAEHELASTLIRQCAVREDHKFNRDLYPSGTLLALPSTWRRGDFPDVDLRGGDKRDVPRHQSVGSRLEDVVEGHDGSQRGN
jgi:hypothetical protein